ncbi:Uncharacterised protein [Vibrio cholerae]|nr:Uncharacterised protein [Vibrio cholerae]
MLPKKLVLIDTLCDWGEQILPTPLQLQVGNG